MSSVPELQQKIVGSYQRAQRRFDPRTTALEGLKGLLVGAVIALISKEVVNSSPRFTLCTIAPALVWGTRGLLKGH